MTAPRPPVIAVTTSGIEGCDILRHVGIAAGTSITGTGFGFDVIPETGDFTGSRVTEWGEEIQRARCAASTEMSQRGLSRVANAIVGVAVNGEVIGQQGSSILVTATRTAVVVEPVQG